MQQPYRLGALLLQKQLISQQQLDSALTFQNQHSGMQLGHVLINMGFVNEAQINKALHKQNRIRLYAACIAFLVAPFQVCNASSEMEDLPEYSYTQVADQHYCDDALEDFSVDHSDEGFDVMELTTAAAWYMYKGGMANNQFNDVPVKVSLATTQKDSYTVKFSVAF